MPISVIAETNSFLFSSYTRAAPYSFALNGAGIGALTTPAVVDSLFNISTQQTRVNCRVFEKIQAGGSQYCVFESEIPFASYDKTEFPPMLLLNGYDVCLYRLSSTNSGDTLNNGSALRGLLNSCVTVAAGSISISGGSIVNRSLSATNPTSTSTNDTSDRTVQLFVRPTFTGLTGMPGGYRTGAQWLQIEVYDMTTTSTSATIRHRFALRPTGPDGVFVSRPFAVRAPWRVILRANVPFGITTNIEYSTRAVV